VPEAIRGLEELKRKLAALPKKAQSRVLRSAFRQAANVIRDAARANAPTGKTGILKRQINTASSRGKPGEIRFKVQARARRVSGKYPEGYPYPLAVEQGHGAPNTRSKKFGKKPSGVEFGSSDTPPHPFMRPALYGSADRALDRAGQLIGEGLEKLAQEPA
jgi:HK97 gp10 family phage protein